MLFSQAPAEELDGKRVIVSRSSMTSVALLELLFENVWHARPEFVAGDAEMSDIAAFDREPHDARLVIGDAALVLRGEARPHVVERRSRLGPARVTRSRTTSGETWKAWTGLPFVFAVWVAQRSAPVAEALGIHASLITSRNWGLEHLARARRAGVAGDRRVGARVPRVPLRPGLRPLVRAPRRSHGVLPPPRGGRARA